MAKINVSGINDPQRIMRLVDRVLNGDPRREFRRATELKKVTVIDVIEEAKKFGVEFENEVELFKAPKVQEIEKAYNAAQNAGCDVALGFKMRCTFEDASIVRQAAEYLQRAGATSMTLKDVNGGLHLNVSIADALETADEMAAAYLALWTNRETKKQIVKNATTIEAVKAVAF